MTPVRRENEPQRLVAASGSDIVRSGRDSDICQGVGIVSGEVGEGERARGERERRSESLAAFCICPDNTSSLKFPY